MTPPKLTESEVRALRDRVYCHRISDLSWDAVRKNWMWPTEVRFLLEHDFPLENAHEHRRDP
jgi:hypothetical protein